VLNTFGGGRSSQFLLEHPDGHQVREDGSHHPGACYNNPVCVEHVQDMIDRIAGLEFEAYFVDEPTGLDCYCPSCAALYRQWYSGNLQAADEKQRKVFRRRCAIQYVESIAGYCKTSHPHLGTMCCLMPYDRALWREASQVSDLDDLGTDIYWVNDDRDVEEMTPLVRELDGLCKAGGKTHHEWLQAWRVRKGRERRIVEQGDILIREKPDALYVWAYLAQIGTDESSEDPDAAWKAACEVLARAKA